jgi:hypothetical protein
LAKSLAYCVQKLLRLGSDTRGTPKRLKRKRVKDSKVEFSEKAEKFVRRKGVRKVDDECGYVLARKSHANNLAKTQAQTGHPVRIFPDKL